MNLKTIIILIGFIFFSLGCNQISNTKTHEEDTNISFQNKGHELIYQMVRKVGSYSDLLKKNDVTYTYTYMTPDGKKNISMEKYLFNGELSYGFYYQHDKVLSDLTGPIEQGYDGKEFWLKHTGHVINDHTLLEITAFNRATNFYWFTMMQKLLDSGLNYEYLGEDNFNGNDYYVVKVSFKKIDDKPTDIYQLYINKNTSLIDQFLFTIVDKGVIDAPFLMEMQYKKIDGMLIPFNRRYKKSNWNAEVTDDPWIIARWSEIRFDNGLKIDDFRKN
ncbi:DUF6503 family protein [Chondrinema litorale]|uniref:DUF6503 family protein n=1 Tax=Chondrinema litorale TaxID=2994555 RepID=UPI002543B676|nr:DUF6503 family protein [Chondrinema litorale]UZR98935.1 hypothetical protein OQ292_34355 [Chondrinema litorale]